MSTRRAFAALSGIAVLLAGGATAGTASAAGPPAVGTRAVADGAVFNDPDSDPKAIERHLISLIDGAAPDSTIRLSTFKYRVAEDTYTDALAAAAGRGVRVEVVVDDHPDNTTYLGELRSRLAATGTGSFVKVCAGSCVKAGDGAIDHDKFFLFSDTGGTRNVVVQTSANMVSLPGNNSGWGSWNNAVTLVSEPAIYDAYLERFDAMASEAVTPYSTTVGDSAKVYFFPRATGHTVAGILDNVDCSGKNTSGGWGPDHLTSIHVAMYEINDPVLAKKIWELDNDGCVVHYVRTNVGEKDDEAIATMNNCSAHNGVTIDTFNEEYGFLHSKYLVIDGFYDGSPNQRLLWTGSYNYTTGALRSNDEALVKIWNRPAIFAAFQDNFQDVAAAARQQNDTVQAGDGVESPDRGAMACFEPAGEHLRVYDGKADDHRAVVEYTFSFAPGTVNYAHNTGGVGTWRDVDLTMPEDSTVTFRACVYEKEQPIPGGCGPYLTKSANG